MDDPAFWCSSCEDLPSAEIAGIPAEDLPVRLELPNGLVCHIVPPDVPSEDRQLEAYRPYSKRTFLRQYQSWLHGMRLPPCASQTSVDVFPKFDMRSQEFTDDIASRITDTCDGRRCQFLQERALRPVDVECSTIKLLCTVGTEAGLCDTGDEAMILQWYLLMTGASHYPMLIPQPAILSGQRRPDFVVFAPVSRFQYRPLAILIDRPGKDPERMDTEAKDYEGQRFAVKRFEVGSSKSFFKIARDIKNLIDLA